MFDYINFIIIFIIGLVSPGPDFIIVTKNAIAYGSNKTFLTVLGIGLGNIIHGVTAILFLTLLGVYFDNYITYLRYGGALYLSYLGVKMILKKADLENLKEESSLRNKRKFFLQGLMINLSNVKVIIFFSSLFSLFIDTPNFNWAKKILFVMTAFFICMLWFILVTKFFSADQIRQKLLRGYSYFSKFLGALLIFFSINLLFY